MGARAQVTDAFSPSFAPGIPSGPVASRRAFVLLTDRAHEMGAALVLKSYDPCWKLAPRCAGLRRQSYTAGLKEPYVRELPNVHLSLLAGRLIVFCE